MILLASHVAAVRRRWREAIGAASPVDEAADRAQLERRLAAMKPGMLLLDVALPGLQGAGGVAALRALSPGSRIVVASRRPADREGIAVLRAGAAGYCARDLDAGLLRKAVAVVQAGEIWAGRALVARVVAELSSLTRRREGRDTPPADGRLERLTDRERDIALLLAAGATNKEIADRLAVTERTVKAHLTAVFRKLGFTDRLRLALYLNETRLGNGTGPRSNLRRAPAR
jgi:two-component system NarL family response regulator